MEPAASQPKPKTSLASNIGGAIILLIAILIIADRFSGPSYTTPHVSGVMSVSGGFIESTKSTDRRREYKFEDLNGKLRYFSCDRLRSSMQFNTCLAYQGGVPAPEFGGILVEVQYIVAEYQPSLIGRLLKEEPISHEILIAVRNESGVIATNRVWVNSASQ